MRHDSIERIFASFGEPQIGGDNTATEWIHGNEITGSDGTTVPITLSYMALGDYGRETENGHSTEYRGRWWLVAANAMRCPVASDCDDRHSMLMVMRNVRIGANDQWEFYDATLAILHGFNVENVPVLNRMEPNTPHTLWQTGVTEAVSNVMGSMQFRNPNNITNFPDGYAATVYDDHITMVENQYPRSSTPVAYRVPAHRHLVTMGECIAANYGDDATLWARSEYFYSLPYTTPGESMLVRERVQYGDHPRPKTVGFNSDQVAADIADASVEELVAVVASEQPAHLNAVIAERDQTIAELQRIIERAREAELERTLNDSGCEDGKTDFLLSTGLHGSTDAEVRSIVRQEEDYEVFVTVSFEVCVGTRSMTSSEADDFNVYQFNDCFGQTDIDDAIRDYISENDVDAYSVRIEMV